MRTENVRRLSKGLRDRRRPRPERTSESWRDGRILIAQPALGLMTFSFPLLSFSPSSNLVRFFPCRLIALYRMPSDTHAHDFLFLITAQGYPAQLLRFQRGRDTGLLYEQFTKACWQGQRQGGIYVTSRSDLTSYSLYSHYVYRFRKITSQWLCSTVARFSWSLCS